VLGADAVATTTMDRGRKTCGQHDREAKDKVAAVMKRIKQLEMIQFSSCKFC
jgi:hypothetical protein